MFKNKTGFWSWQGNNLPWHNFYLYIAFAIMLIVLAVIWVLRFRIRRWWENKNKWLFAFHQERHFWMFIGAIIILIQIIRLIFFLDYVNKWELLPLHLCRLHITVLGFLLLFGKQDWVKYTAIMAFIGVSFAFVFGKLTTDIPYDTLKNANENLTWEAYPKEWTHAEKLMALHGYFFYNVGPDNFFFYEFFFAHMLIATLPAFIWVARHNKMSLKEFFYMQIGYFVMAFFAWAFDWATAGVKDARWNANLWYIGTNANNDMSRALGWLSSWPQNLITYAGLLGVTVTWMVYLIILGSSNIKWFEDGKVVSFKHSQLWIWFKRDFRKIVLRKKVAHHK